MARQIILNIIIAILWMFLQETYDFIHFLIGYIIGIGLLFLLNRFIPDEFYFKRVWAMIKLLLLFNKELILANVDVVKMVYSPKMEMQPGIIAFPTELKTNWEITLLANLISLTPGTLSVEISHDNAFIYIHAMDLPDTDETIGQIKNTFEKTIMEVTR